MRRASWAVLVAMLGLAAPACAAPAIASTGAMAGPDDPYAVPPQSRFARGGGSGPLVIRYRGGKSVRVPLDLDEQGQQLEFSQIRIAPDRHSIGWLASYGCGQAQPCPLALVVWHQGRPVLRFVAHHGVIESWQFLAGGRQVAVQTRQPDGTTRYWLLATASGLAIADWQPGSGTRRPPWLAFFTRAHPP